LHRDVKPANVLLQRRSHRIKLADFGISKLLESTGRARTVVGTPYYLSPEIVSGQAYGPAADAWALGVCLFELAALRRPFEAGNPLALVRRICEEPPLGLPQETVPDIQRAIVGLLERDPAVRLTLSEALQVSDAVAALAAMLPSDEPSPSQQQVCSPFYPSSPCTLAACNELSPVSIATTDSGCASSPEEAAGTAELVASLGGTEKRAGGSTFAPPRPKSAMVSLRAPPPAWRWAGSEVEAETEAACNSWQCCEAVLQARAALSADVDDPEELQQALVALETQAVGNSLGACEALRCELRLRIAALRADAAALLQSLLEGPRKQVPPERTARTAAGHQLPPQWVPVGNLHDDTVTTLCEEAPDDLAALETAIELCTSLGVDTGPAEEQASARGLLSLRVAWGRFTRFLLLPVRLPFKAILVEIARRFGLPFSKAGCTSFELWCREGSEVLPLNEQGAWEACVRRNGVASRPGRLDIRLEASSEAPPLVCRVRGDRAEQAPFLVTGTRLTGPTGSPSLRVPSTKDGKENFHAGNRDAAKRGQRPPLPVGQLQRTAATGSCSSRLGLNKKREKPAIRRCGAFGEVPSIAIFGAPAASPPLHSARSAGSAVSVPIPSWGIKRCSSKGPSSSGAPLQLQGRGQRSPGLGFRV